AKSSLISVLLAHRPSFFQPSPHHQDLHSFPTRRSSDLDSSFINSGLIVSRSHPASSIIWLVLRKLAPITSVGYPNTSQIIELARSEEHTSELQSRFDLVCRLLLE